MSSLEALRRLLDAGPTPSTWYRAWRLVWDCRDPDEHAVALDHADAQAAGWPAWTPLVGPGGSGAAATRLASLLAWAHEEPSAELLPDLLAAALFAPGSGRASASDALRVHTDAGVELATQADDWAATLAFQGSEDDDREFATFFSVPDVMGKFRQRPDLDWTRFCQAALLWTADAAGALDQPSPTAFAALCAGQVGTGDDGGPSLRLSAPNVARLPAGLGTLHRLAHLRLAIDRLEALPDDLCELAELRSLQLELMWELKTLPADFRRLSALTTLQLWTCGFAGIPAPVFDLPALTHLDFNGGTRSTEQIVDAGIGRLATLRTLEITNGRLDTLPPEIGALSQLRSLTLHGSRLRTLPERIGELENLEELSIIGSLRLAELPASLGRLQKLRSFSAMWWARPEPPAGLAEIPALRSVHLSADVRMNEQAIAALRTALPEAKVLVSYAATVR